MSQPPRYRPQLRSLTSLRFFAAMLVVGYHCSFDFQTPAWFGDFLKNGYEAVSFFFVLSGFILTYVYAPRMDVRVPRRVFWTARVARICPIYFLALLIDLPRVLYSGFVAHTTSVPGTAAALVTAPLFVQSWFPSIESVWNTPAWSLSVEAFFYAIFPWMVERLGVISRATMMGFAVVLVLITGTLRSVAVGEVNGGIPIFTSSLLHYWPPLHLPQFLLGMAAARFYMKGSRLRPTQAETLGCLVAVAICAIFWFRSHLPSFVGSDAILGPLYALLIYMFAQSQGITSSTLSHRLLVGLGEISYGIYILHVPLYFLWVRGIHYLTGSSALPIWTFWFFLALLLFSALILYRTVEIPCRLSAKRWSNRSMLRSA